MVNVTITADDGDVRTYLMPYGASLQVKEGEQVEAGLPAAPTAPCIPRTCCGSAASHAVQDYLIQEVQKRVPQQGVDINDKHIEVIVPPDDAQGPRGGRRRHRPAQRLHRGPSSSLRTPTSSRPGAHRRRRDQRRLELKLPTCTRCCWVSPRHLWPPIPSCPLPPSRRPPRC